VPDQHTSQMLAHSTALRSAAAFRVGIAERSDRLTSGASLLSFSATVGAFLRFSLLVAPAGTCRALQGNAGWQITGMEIYSSRAVQFFVRRPLLRRAALRRLQPLCVRLTSATSGRDFLPPA
jgi:hypothetical protein